VLSVCKPTEHQTPHRARGSGFCTGAFALLIVIAFATRPRPLYGLFRWPNYVLALTISVIYVILCAGTQRNATLRQGPLDLRDDSVSFRTGFEQLMARIPFAGDVRRWIRHWQRRGDDRGRRQVPVNAGTKSGGVKGGWS
jgi:hypothetical protein